MRERRASDTQRGLMDGAAIYKSSTPKKQKTKEDWNAFRKTDLFFFYSLSKTAKKMFMIKVLLILFRSSEKNNIWRYITD